MTKGSYLIIRRSALKVDGWTYGDFRQYVAFLDDGAAVCCRMSRLPAFAFMVGACFVLLAGICFLVPGADQSRLFWLAFTGLALCGPEVVSWPTGWRLVVCVGNRMKADADGGYTRKF